MSERIPFGSATPLTTVVEPSKAAEDKVPAVRRAATILRAISRARRMTLAELVEETNLNKSTVFYLVGALTALEFLQADDQTLTYTLGPALIELGVAASEEITDLGVAKRYLAGLLELPNVTLTISTRLDVHHTLLIDKIERLHRPRITFPLGSPVSVLTGAAGRAFLAFDDDATVAEALSAGLPHHTPRSIVDPELFRAELSSARQTGWTVDEEGYILGVTTLSAPIFSADGSVKLVGSAVGFSGAFDNRGVQKCGAQLRTICDRIGQVLAGGVIPGPHSKPWLDVNPTPPATGHGRDR